MNSVLVNFGSIGFSTAYGVNRLVGTPTIDMRIAGRSTASVSVIADSAIVPPDTFAIGTPCNIQNFTNQPANDGIEFLSSDADDTSKEILFIGVDTGGTVRYEAIETHYGDARNAVSTTRTDWAELYEVHVPADMIGTLTVREASGNETIITVPPGTRFVSDRLFSGFLDSVRVCKVVETASSSLMRYDCDFVDVGQVLDRRICLEDFGDTDIGTIIDTLLTNYLTAEGFVRTWGNVDRIHATVAAVTVANLNAAYKPISEVLNELARIAGCSWWVTPYRVLYMAAEGDNPIPAPVTVSESVAVSNLSMQATKGDYRNREYLVYDVIDAADTTESKYCDGEATSWPTGRRVYELKSMDVDGSARRCAAAGDAAKTTIVSAVAGAGFEQLGVNSTVDIVSSSDDDNQTVTIYGLNVSNEIFATPEVLNLNGTTPVTGVYGYNFVLGIVLSDATVGNVTVTWTTAGGGGKVTICTITAGNTSAGVYTVPTATTEYWVKPTVSVDQSALVNSYVGVRYIDVGNNTAYQMTYVEGIETNTLAAVCKKVEQIYTGNVAADDTITVIVEAEYQFTQNQYGFRQSSYGAVNALAVVLTAVYTGMEEGLYIAEDAAAIAAMDTLEGASTGTGVYEHATILKEPILATEAAARVTALMNKYGDFPKELSFDTYIPWWFPGQLLTASLASNFGEDGTEFVVTDVTIRESDQPSTDDYKWQYHVIARCGQDYSVFDRVEIYRQLRARQQYVASKNLVTS